MKKSSCTWIKKHLVSLGESTLPPDLQKEIRMHLRDCPRCDKLAREFSLLWNELAPRKGPEHPVSLWPGLERAIKEQTGRARKARGFSQRIPGLLRPVAAALGLILAIGTGWELGRPGTGTKSQLRLEQTGTEEMYISEYLEPFRDIPVGSLADLYLDSESSDEDTTP